MRLITDHHYCHRPPPLSTPIFLSSKLKGKRPICQTALIRKVATEDVLNFIIGGERKSDGVLCRKYIYFLVSANLWYHHSLAGITNHIRGRVGDAQGREIAQWIQPGEGVSVFLQPSHISLIVLFVELFFWMLARMPRFLQLLSVQTSMLSA